MASRGWLAAVLVAVALAGCAENSKDPEAQDPLVGESAFDQFELKETPPQFGVIRGLVVDGTLRPVEGALVELMDAGRNTTTASDGLFAFKDVPPGTHFLTTSRDKYVTVQSSVDVVAGVAEPEVVKVRLDRIPGTEPRVVADTYKGFMQCSIRVPAAGFNDGCVVFSNIGLGSTQRTRVGYPGPNILWWQGELIWSSSSPTSERLCFSASRDTLAGGVNCGANPRIQAMDRELVIKADIEEGETFEIVAYPDHLVAGASGNLVVQQAFEFVHHAFYNFVPPEGWTFYNDGAPVTPP